MGSSFDGVRVMKYGKFGAHLCAARGVIGSVTVVDADGLVYDSCRVG